MFNVIFTQWSQERRKKEGRTDQAKAGFECWCSRYNLVSRACPNTGTMNDFSLSFWHSCSKSSTPENRKRFSRRRVWSPIEAVNSFKKRVYSISHKLFTLSRSVQFQKNVYKSFKKSSVSNHFLTLWIRVQSPTTRLLFQEVFNFQPFLNSFMKVSVSNKL